MSTTTETGTEVDALEEAFAVEDDFVHIECRCQYWAAALSGDGRHYALCGVDTTDDEVWAGDTTGETCPDCAQVEREGSHRCNAAFLARVRGDK